LTAFGLALVIFVAGAVVGFMVHRIHVAHDPGGGVGCCGQGGCVSHQHQLQAFRIHLDLSDAQAEQIDEIMRRTNEEIRAVRGGCHPRIREVQMRAQQQIMELLDEEQRTEYERMIAHTRLLHHGSEDG